MLMPVVVDLGGGLSSRSTYSCREALWMAGRL